MRLEITLNGKSIREIKGIVDLSSEICLDYLTMPGCQFGVTDYGQPDCISDCGEPAVAIVWWNVTKNGEPLRPTPVCQEHFQQILSVESEDEKTQ